MKLGVLAASTVIAVASLGSVSFAQSGGTDGSVVNRSSRSGSTDSVARVPVLTQAPTLEGARPAAGMFPMQPSGPVRDVSGRASNSPGEGGDLRSFR